MRTPRQDQRRLKVVVRLESRDDGGLRAYSDDIPGFVLSHHDPQAVLADIVPALEFMLSEIWDTRVLATNLEPISAFKKEAEQLPALPECKKEYVVELQ